MPASYGTSLIRPRIRARLPRPLPHLHLYHRRYRCKASQITDAMVRLHTGLFAGLLRILALWKWHGIALVS